MPSSVGPCATLVATTLEQMNRGVERSGFALKIGRFRYHGRGRSAVTNSVVYVTGMLRSFGMKTYAVW